MIAGKMTTFPTRRRRPGRAAFTVLEVLIVISVILVLVSLLLPAVQQAREAARRTGCRNNLMQIGLALRNYESAHGCLPPGSIDPNRPIRNDGKGYNFGWVVQILPQLEQSNIYFAFDFSVSVYDKANATAAGQPIPNFTCPSRGGYAACHHDVEAPIDVDNNGVMFLNSSVRRDDLRDGASHTIFVGEGGAFAGLGWATGTRDTLRNTGSPIGGANLGGFGGASPLPAQANINALAVGGFSSSHIGGANFVFGDGAVHSVAENVSPKILRQLGHRADGELPAGDF